MSEIQLFISDLRVINLLKWSFNLSLITVDAIRKTSSNSFRRTCWIKHNFLCFQLFQVSFYIRNQIFCWCSEIQIPSVKGNLMYKQIGMFVGYWKRYLRFYWLNFICWQLFISIYMKTSTHLKSWTNLIRSFND